MGLTLGGILAASVASWLLGRLHLRATALRALDQAVHLPDGTLEQKVNAAVEGSALAAAQKLAPAIDAKLGVK